MERSEFTFLNRISTVDSIDKLFLTFESIFKEVIFVDFGLTTAKLRYRKGYKDRETKNLEIDFTQIENIFLKKNVVFIKNPESFLINHVTEEENFNFVVLPIILNKSLKNLIIVKPLFSKEIFMLSVNIILNLLEKLSYVNLVEKSKLYFETILNNINSTIIIVDKNYNIIFSNFEKPNVYKCYDLAFGKQFPCEFCFFENKSITRKIYDKHFEIQHIVFDSKLICIIKDITSYIKMKQELIKSQQLSMLGKFSGEIAHEIKNPLNSIKLKLELIKRKTKNLKEIEDIEKEIIRLSQIAGEFLELGKTLNLNYEEFNLRDILEELKDRYANKIKFLISQCSIKVNADKNKLLQVFINLIKNSIEANATVIEILCKKLDDKVEISIIDNGEGISNPENIFTPFYTEKESGSGLGLIICQRIIEAHKGKLIFVKDNTKKTEFKIELPL